MVTVIRKALVFGWLWSPAGVTFPLINRFGLISMFLNVDFGFVCGSPISILGGVGKKES